MCSIVMTLLIAGYKFDLEIDYSFSLDETSITEESALKPSTEVNHVRRHAEPSGVFVAADSAITSATETLLSGFRKIYPMTVKLWEPYFVADSFCDYLNVYMETEIVLGFAGSTLTAQHCLNGLAEHLSKLRISYKRQTDGQIQYIVLMDCEANPLRDAGHCWSDDTFTSLDFRGILTAECIAHVIHHSLKASLISAGKYKISEKGFETLLTPFVAGIFCPATQRFHLYEFKMNTETISGVFQVRVEKQLVPHNKVAVLGLAKEFESDAQAVYSQAYNAGNSTEAAIFNFLNDAIDTVKSRGDRGIDRPAVLKVLSRNGLEIAERQ